MACRDCGRGFFFTLLTLITIGASCALLIALVVLFVQLKLTAASTGLFAGLVVAMCVSLLLLFYGFYASVYGTACHKAVLSIVYCIFALALGALGICVIVLKNTISDDLGKYWATHETEMAQVEKRLDCFNWTQTNSSQSGKESCKDVFDTFYNNFGKGIAAGLLVLFVILMVGDVFAWKFVCDRVNGRSRLGDGSDGSKQLTAPLTYSW
jgi:hypothetical protein